MRNRSGRNNFLAMLAGMGVMLALAIAAPAWASNAQTQEFHQTYSLNSNGRLSLENINGSVTISGWDKNQVEVDAVKTAPSSDMLNKIQIRVESSPDSIHIHTEYPHGVFSHSGNWRVDYTIKAPRHANLEKINLVNGSIDVDNFSGDVRVSSVNGRVKARDLSGEAHLSTVNGPVDALFANPDIAKPVSVNSVNGPIALTLPPDVHTGVSAHTVNGNIHNDFGLQVTGHFVGHNLQGSIGGGGSAHIDLSDVNGAIAIRSAASAAN